LTKTRFLVLVFNLCLFLCLAYWIIKYIDFRILLSQFSLISIWSIFGAAVIFHLGLLMYGFRMALLLNCNVVLGCKITTLGYALNTIMPFRLGELVKIVLTNRLWGISKTQIFSASILEKIADISKLVLFTGLITFISGFWPEVLFERLQVLYVIVFVLSIIIGCVLFAYFHISKFIRMLPKHGDLRKIVIDFHKYAGVYPLGLICISTFGIWVANVVLIFFSINSFLPQVNLSFANAAILYFLLSFAIAVPSAPAGIGIFEAVTTTYLSHTLGVPYENGLAAASVLHAVVSIPQLLLCFPLLRFLFTSHGKLSK
jgi:uncharacterized membrane protein YbhN (UPF0104 family)